MARDDIDNLPPQRPGPDAAEPPPVPVSHPAGKSRLREAFRIPIAFYVEIAISAALLLLHYFVAAAIAPTYVPVLLIPGIVVSVAACVVRMVKRVVKARAKGKPPLEATILFWLSLAVPAAIAGVYVRHEVNSYDPLRERQLEAKRILGRAVAAEKDFHESYGRYTYNVKELPFGPVPGARYVLGFPAACTAKFSIEGAKSSWDLFEFPFSKTKKIEIEEFFKSERPENCPDPKDGFVLFAAGQLRDDGPLDIWKVDAGGKLVHVRNGR